MKKTAYQNREISWLSFNNRVLFEATRDRTPLFEKLKFLDIVHKNLDEFFMIRVGGLMDQDMLKPEILDTKTHWNASKQLSEVCKEVKNFYTQVRTSFDLINGELKKSGHEILLGDKISKSDASMLEPVFYQELTPLLIPQIIDPKHPFPQLINQQVYVLLELERKGKREIGIISLNPLVLTMIYPLKSRQKTKFVQTIDIVYFFSDKLFKEWKVLSKGLIRVTRNADLNLEESDDVEMGDYRSALRDLIKKRARMSPVRLESTYDLSDAVISDVRKAINLPKQYHFKLESPMNYRFLGTLEDILLRNNPSWFYQRRRLDDSLKNQHESILKQLLIKDMFFTTPFQTFSTYLNFLQEACQDPKVFSIQVTLYRLANNSRVFQYLIQAAESGKDVSVLLELKARFDETNNIEWSSKLEESGVRVVYGIPYYKVHSKVTLIKRKEGRSIQFYTHIGTGNYNESTAKQYTDFHMLTSNPDIGYDAMQIFNQLFTSTLDESFKPKHLWFAPYSMKSKILEYIDKEIQFQEENQSGKIIIKANALTDLDLVQALIHASKHGVKVQLIIRGICCLVPGIKDVSENIEVISLVGRYLEHSRIYYFHHRGEEIMYISSADGMTRNMTKRVEVAAPILDKNQKERIKEMLEMYLDDSENRWIMQEDASYVRAKGQNKSDVQSELFNTLKLEHSSKQPRNTLRKWMDILQGKGTV